MLNSDYFFATGYLQKIPSWSPKSVNFLGKRRKERSVYYEFQRNSFKHGVSFDVVGANIVHLFILLLKNNFTCRRQISLFIISQKRETGPNRYLFLQYKLGKNEETKSLQLSNVSCLPLRLLPFEQYAQVHARTLQIRW